MGYVVASGPQISPLRAELCSSPATAIRQSGYLPARRPLGFASPPRSGFAFPQLTRMRQPAGTFPMLAMNAPYSESSTHAIPLGGFLPHVDDACVWLCVTLSLLMPALLPVGDESLTNFRELRLGEVRRIPLPRTPVNKANEKRGARLGEYVSVDCLLLVS